MEGLPRNDADLLSDHQLGQLVDGAQAIGAGIGGTSALLHVAGVPVFVKRIPLTDLERGPQNVMSIANLFGLPTYCQYGIGGRGSAAVQQRIQALAQASASVVLFLEYLPHNLDTWLAKPTGRRPRRC